MNRLHLEPIGCGWAVAPGSKRAPCNGGGGGSSSSNETTTQNIDKRLVVDSGIGISSDSSTLNVTALDGGAVSRAFEFAAKNVDLMKDADALQGQTVQQLLGLTDRVFDGAFKVLDKNADIVKASSAFVSDAYDNAKGEGDTKKLIAAGVIAAVAIVAVKSFGKAA